MDSSSQMEGDATARSSPCDIFCTNGDNDCYREVLKLKSFKTFLANEG